MAAPASDGLAAAQPAELNGGRLASMSIEKVVLLALLLGSCRGEPAPAPDGGAAAAGTAALPGAKPAHRTAPHPRFLPGPPQRPLDVAARSTEQSPALSIWDRGGAPGPSYQQDLLKVWQDGATARALYQKVRFDPVKPPYRADAFELELPAAEKVKLMQLAAPAMVRLYAEESDPKIGDVTRISVTLGPEPAQVKTFFKRLPPELDPLREAATALMKRCETTGTLRPPAADDR
jgi:hypothetical protein